MAHRFLIVPFLIALLPPFLPAQDIGATQGEIAQRVQHLMSVEVGFEEMVPPGTSIEAKEISRNGKSGNDLIVRYHIFVKGVGGWPTLRPPGQRLPHPSRLSKGGYRCSQSPAPFTGAHPKFIHHTNNPELSVTRLRCPKNSNATTAPDTSTSSPADPCS